MRADLVDDLPYELAIADHDRTYSCLAVYDGNSIAGVLVNDAGAAAEWTVDVFESYRAGAKTVAE